MFRNYLTVALRNLVKHRLYSAINIAGLAIGLAASILILLFVRNETSYDQAFSSSDRTYQMVIHLKVPGRPQQWVSNSAFAMAPAFQRDHAEVEDFARVVTQRAVVRRGEERFYEELLLVDSSFLNIFNFPLVAGERAAALDDPSGLVLTASMARKYFGTTDAVGRVLTLDGRHDLKVTAVVEDLPTNTHLSFKMLLPLNSPVAGNWLEQPENWGALCCSSYIRLKQGADAEAVLAGVADWSRRTAPALQTPQGPVALGEIMTPRLRPVSSIHTEPMLGDLTAGTSMTEIRILVAIAVLILSIASINFMNLATARATQRAREVSIRKVVGASRGQIIVQFIGESLLLTLLGLVLAVALAELAMPAYASFINKALVLDYGDPGLLGLLLGLGLLVGVAGGAYPAFFLSHFNPSKVLKGSASGVGGGSGRLRSALVVVQFTISISLMVATAVVYAQLLYSQDKDLGFDKDNILLVGHWSTAGVAEHREAFMETLRHHPGVESVAVGSFIPGDFNESNTLVHRPDTEGKTEVVMRQDPVGFDYFETLGMRIIAGRSFERDRGTDILRRPEWQEANQPPPADVTNLVLPVSIVINRTAVAALGFTNPEQAIGQQIISVDSPVSSLRGTIVGVVEDFHFRSLHEPISPAFYYVYEPPLHAMAIRARGGQVREVADLIDRTWVQMIKDRPIERGFLDGNIDRLYERERIVAHIFATFSSLAIVIACMGLFGLASFTSERRTKEIGLRKVLGAQVVDIVRLLVWQFSKPVLLATLIAWPMAWWGTSKWLEGFAYRIDLTPLPFLLAGACALAIAWITVGAHAARLAQSKPVTALRYE